MNKSGVVLLVGISLIGGFVLYKTMKINKK